jgi:4-carboxymuconolactone decarboxylase
MNDERLDPTGLRTRREVLGPDHVRRSLDGADDFTRPFQEFITRYAWGDVWSRPGLDRRTRSIVTLSALVALGAENELPMHVRAAVRHGLAPAEISEILLHTSIYAGLPAANAAFAIAQATLREDGHLPATEEAGDGAAAAPGRAGPSPPTGDDGGCRARAD